MIVSVVLFFLLSGNNNEGTLKDFYTLISEKKYDEMYDCISEESQKKYDKETFVTRNQNIYEGIEANQLSIEVLDEELKQISFCIDEYFGYYQCKDTNDCPKNKFQEFQD